MEGPVTRLVRLLSSQEWSFLATSFAWLAALAGGLALGGRAAKRARGTRGLWRAAFTGLAAFVLTLGAVVQSNASSPAIVTALAAPVLVAPYAAAASESTLPVGTMVLTEHLYDGYVQVEGPGGLSGWVLAPASIPSLSPAAEGATMHVALIEDDEKIGTFVSQGLKQEGHVVSWSRNGTEGLALARDPGMDLLIVDVMLPGKDGLAIVRALRESKSALPIIIPARAPPWTTGCAGSRRAPTTTSPSRSPSPS